MSTVSRHTVLSKAKSISKSLDVPIEDLVLMVSVQAYGKVLDWVAEYKGMDAAIKEDDLYYHGMRVILVGDDDIDIVVGVL